MSNTKSTDQLDQAINEVEFIENGYNDGFAGMVYPLLTDCKLAVQTANNESLSARFNDLNDKLQIWNNKYNCDD